MLRTCKKHGETRHVVEQSTGYYRCAKCRNEKTGKHRRDRIIEFKNRMGGKCSICGYDKCLDALDFHHVDPSQKEFSFRDRRGISRERLEIELAKCVLVCANCHREIHSSRG
jgi:hypothetical protein